MTNLPAPIKPELVHCNLKAGSKEDALRELVQVLASHEPSIVIEDILQALDERERKGPFSIAKGVAFPHARTEGVQDFTIVLGTKPGGLDFRAPDGQQVQIVVLFVIPKKHSNLYLRTLAWFLNFFREHHRTDQVASLSSPNDVIAALGGDATTPTSTLFEECAYTVFQDTPLRSLVALMGEHKLDVVPVVDKDKSLVGEVTTSTIFQFVSQQQDTDSMEDLLTKEGDLSIKKFITTDLYLETSSEKDFFQMAKDLGKENRLRMYWTEEGKLKGVVTLPGLLSQYWNKR